MTSLSVHQLREVWGILTDHELAILEGENPKYWCKGCLVCVDKGCPIGGKILSEALVCHSAGTIILGSD